MARRAIVADVGGVRRVVDRFEKVELDGELVFYLQLHTANIYCKPVANSVDLKILELQKTATDIDGIFVSIASKYYRWVSTLPANSSNGSIYLYH